MFMTKSVHKRYIKEMYRNRKGQQPYELSKTADKRQIKENAYKCKRLIKAFDLAGQKTVLSFMYLLYLSFYIK